MGYFRWQDFFQFTERYVRGLVGLDGGRTLTQLGSCSVNMALSCLTSDLFLHNAFAVAN